MKGLKRNIKTRRSNYSSSWMYVKKPRQVKNWLELLKNNFGNVTLDEVFIPSFDCRWNFASSSNKDHS